jgi:hypothetical protein
MTDVTFWGRTWICKYYLNTSYLTQDWACLNFRFRCRRHTRNPFVMCKCREKVSDYDCRDLNKLHSDNKLYTPQFSSRDQTVRFNYVTSLRVEGKQTHIKGITDIRTETASYKAMPLGKVYSMDSICLSATPLIPLPFTSKGRGMHRFVTTTAK